MPRFQLLIRELGKSPRLVPLTKTLVVGRSRRADLVLDDEEVGREQFRIGVTGSTVMIEGIGQTNKTTVDGTCLDPGQRVTVTAGASIKVGRTVVQVQAADATESAPPRPGAFDATMVAAGPALGSPGNPDVTMELKDEEQTGGFRGPGGPAAGPTAGPTAGPRPGAPNKTPPPVDENFGQTMNVKGAFRPGQPGPTPAAITPAPPPVDDNNGQTIQVKGAFRPGQPGQTPPSAPPPRPKAAEPEVTINVKGGFRPGRTAEPPPPTPSAPPPMAPRQVPAAAVPSAAEPPAERTPTPPPGKQRAKTVVVNPQDMVAEPTAPVPSTITPVEAANLEQRLHQAVPRLFVKGETIRRRVRLMKVRTKVGRAETADVLLPNESVSELHAEIEFDGTTWSLRDCGSTNGTLVDGTVLRSRSQPITRNSLLGFGNLRGLFLCNDPATLATDRRHEERALRLLVAAGRLDKAVGNQVLALARSDSNQSIAEILLSDTPIEPTDWANAIVTVRQRVTLFDRLRRLFSRAKPPKAR